MANTLTNLIPDLYEGMDMVANELTGFIPAVSMDNQAARAALNQTIYIPQTQSQSAADNTAAATVPDTGTQTIGNTTMTIDKSRHVAIRWEGEEQRGYKSNGTWTSTIAQQFAQAVRALRNEIEADIAQEYVLASRAFGTAGTTPFATTLEDAAQIKKILDDNGCPLGDRALVIDTSAGLNLRKLTNLNQANTAGSDSLLRQGVLLPIFGIDIRESAQIQSHTKGTATGFDCTAVEPIGETTIACDGSDSGTVLAGDVVTTSNANDSNKYVVNSGSTLTGNASGNFIINNPGMRVATVIADEWTIGANYTANMAFHRSAIQLATRMPALPEGGDFATDIVQIPDPVTGMVFEVARYPGFLENVLHVRIAWGVKLIKPEFAALLLG